MEDFPFSFFLTALPIMVCIMFVVYEATSYYYKQKHKNIHRKVGNNYIYKKDGIHCQTSRSGGKSHRLFNRCNLYVLDNGILILGYSQLLWFKFYSSSIIITYHPDKYFHLCAHANVVSPNKINPYSFGNSVYIDYGEATWISANVTMHLKGLNDDEKQFFQLDRPL